MTFDFKPYTTEEFLEVAQEVINGQLGKDCQEVPDSTFKFLHPLAHSARVVSPIGTELILVS